MKTEKIKEALFWILVLISIVMLLWRLLGNSPIIEAVILPLLIVLMIDHAILKTKFENFERQFSALAKDFKEHLINHKNIESNISKINEQITNLDRTFIKLSKNIKNLKA